jgi:acyl carrier protein
MLDMQPTLSTSIEQRLAKCFAAAFPDLPSAAIYTATADNVPNWNSLAHMMLIYLIDEEFQIAVELDRVGDLMSFADLLDYVRKRLVGGSTGSSKERQ